MTAKAIGIPLGIVALAATAGVFGESPEPESSRAMEVIQKVEDACKERTIYMIGRAKALRLAELVRESKPGLVVECGTAIGYSGLWIAKELKALGGERKLISIEIDEARADEARKNFTAAGLADLVEVRVGDARKLVREIARPVDLVFIDCNFSNYLPCFVGIEPRLKDGALVIADNVGIGAAGMKGYLDRVRGDFESRTEWFDLDVPWAKRDAMEVTVYRKKGAED